MDADAYVAGKGAVSKVERHGDALLITTQGDVSIVNRQLVEGPAKETGLLPDDLDRLEEQAAAGVAAAQQAVIEAEQRLENVRQLKADAKPHTDAIRAEYAARVQAARDAIAEGSAQLGGK